MSNEKNTATEVQSGPIPYSQSEPERREKTAEIPAVPTTADLPMLPEFRARAKAINWRAALSSAGLAGFLAVIAGMGCGTSTNNMLKPSPATVAVLDKALWVANGTNVVEFIPTQLLAGNSDPAPRLSINSSVFGAPQGVTFDAAGNLWVIDGGTVAAGGNMPPALFEFTTAQLNNLGDLTAISSASPFGVAGFQKAQLIPAKTGPNPNPFLVGATTTLNAPAGCNFGPVVN